MKPFEDATNISQGQNVVTSSEVIICICSLREQLQKLSEKYSCRLLTALQNAVEKRLSKYEGMEELQLAATIDPHYKVDWCTDEEFDIIRGILLKKAEDITPCRIFEDAPPPAKDHNIIYTNIPCLRGTLLS